MFRLKRLGQQGLAHHALVPLLVVFTIAGIGAYVVSRSNANTIYANGAIYTGYSFVNQDGSSETHASYNSATASAEYVTFSPDGTRVSYWTTDSSGAQRLHVAKSDNSEPQVIFTTTESLRTTGAASWSKDGIYLAFTQYQQGTYDQQELAIIKADGTGYESVATFVDEFESQHFVVAPSFYSDSATIGYISFFNGKSRLCKANISSSDSSCIDIKLDDAYQVEHDRISISADDTTVLITTGISDPSNCNTEGGCAYAENIHKVAVNTGVVKNVTNFAPALEFNNINSVTFSPDNTKIAYSFASSTQGWSTYVANTDGSGQKMVSRNGHYVAWQPYIRGADQPPVPFDLNDISCRIDSTSADLIVGKPTEIKVTFTNNSPTPVKASPYVWQRLWKNTGKWTEYPVTATSTLSINPGASKQITVPSIVIPYDTSGYDELNLNMMQENGSYGAPMWCSASFTLPKPPVTISGSSPRVVPYNKPMTISGTAAAGAYGGLYVGGKFVGGTYASSKGVFSITYTPTADISFYMQVFGRNSATHVAKVRATVNGAATRIVKKNTNVTISGTYKPNSTLKVYMRKPGDPAGKYPRVITTKTNKSGSYTFSFKSDSKKVFYVQAPNGTKTPLYTVKLK